MNLGRSALPSIIGFDYQEKYALLLAIREWKLCNYSSVIYYEKYDDILIENESLNFYQVKHVNKVLNETSLEFWKTIGNWINTIRSDDQALDNSNFTLVTIQLIESDSILKKISSNEPVESIYGSLFNLNIENIQVIKYHKCFKEFDENKCRKLLNKIKIIDGSPDFNNIDNLIIKEFVPWIRTIHMNQFLKDFCAWWHQRIDTYKKDPNIGIDINEIEVIYHDLNSKYSGINLPVVEQDETVLSPSKNIYIRQLELLKVKTERINMAISEFTKAFTNRYLWIKNCRISSLEEFDKNLIKEWAIKFNSVVDTISNNASSAIKIQKGKEVLDWMELDSIKNPSFYKLMNFNDSSIIRGSYHILADDLTVGWHPDYKGELEHAL